MRGRRERKGRRREGIRWMCHSEGVVCVWGGRGGNGEKMGPGMDTAIPRGF